MFIHPTSGLNELTVMQEDVAAILDIKEDIREECTKIGEVTNVVLYDKEPEGVVSVKFADPEAAQQCVKVCQLSIQRQPQVLIRPGHGWPLL